MFYIILALTPKKGVFPYIDHIPHWTCFGFSTRFLMPTEAGANETNQNPVPVVYLCLLKHFFAAEWRWLEENALFSPYRLMAVPYCACHQHPLHPFVCKCVNICECFVKIW